MAIFLSRGQKMEGGRQKMTNWRFLALPNLAWTDFWGPPENPGGPTENAGFQFFGLREKNGRTFFVFREGQVKNGSAFFTFGGFRVLGGSG